ncbi:GNAT family N-acetyltransferase [Streptomyces prasinopilosus]|uniref:GNAT family N-acetyltransferase n=1 Tax=Streptomyces prasinopilosus TaxID=67344 RepID=UPI0006EB83B6|nr:GNAT family N-acetyltransferase [Streptomyces prasinopilosus]
MDPSATLALFDRELREGARPDGPGARVERVGPVVRQTAPRHGWNGVLWSGLNGTAGTGERDEGGPDPRGTDADGAIAAQIAYFTGLDRTFEWKLYGHDLPVDLGQRLVAAGFTPGPEETLMIGEISGLRLGAELPEGVRIAPVTDRAGVDLVVDVHEKAFRGDASWLRHRLLDRLAAAPGTVVAVVALAGGEPVSAARMELVPGTRFAGLWGGGTVDAWRGRGLYRALVAHRARVAAGRGYRYLQVDASGGSRPILERLGFVPLTTTTPYVYVP